VTFPKQFLSAPLIHRHDMCNYSEALKKQCPARSSKVRRNLKLNVLVKTFILFYTLRQFKICNNFRQPPDGKQNVHTIYSSFFIGHCFKGFKTRTRQNIITKSTLSIKQIPNISVIYSVFSFKD